MHAEGSLVTDSLELVDEFSILDTALPHSHLKGIGLRIPQVHVVDVLENRVPRRRLFLAENKMAGVERYAEAWHVAAKG